MVRTSGDILGQARAQVPWYGRDGAAFPDLHDGRSAKFWQNVARFRLYGHRFLQENTRFAAFFKIYQIIKLTFLKSGKILQILRRLQNFC